MPIPNPKSKFQSARPYDSPKAHIPAQMLKFQPNGSNPGLKALISASMPKSQPVGWKYQSWGSNPSLKAHTLSLKEEEKFSHMWKQRSSAAAPLTISTPHKATNYFELAWWGFVHRLMEFCIMDRQQHIDKLVLSLSPVSDSETMSQYCQREHSVVGK